MALYHLAPSLVEGFYHPALDAAYDCGKPVIYHNTSSYTDYLNQEVGYPIALVDEEIKNIKLNLSIQQ
ncbi:MAG: hypothetical protein WCF23_03520 [Candidatus Nitrosopolaris sp.]